MKITRRFAVGGLLGTAMVPRAGWSQVTKSIPRTVDTTLASMSVDELVRLVHSAVNSLDVYYTWPARYRFWTSAAIRAGSARCAREGQPVTLAVLMGFHSFKSIASACEDASLDEHLRSECGKWTYCLPGFYTPGKRIPQTTLDGHGMCEMVVTGRLGMLADVEPTQAMLDDIRTAQVDWRALDERKWGT